MDTDSRFVLLGWIVLAIFLCAAARDGYSRSCRHVQEVETLPLRLYCLTTVVMSAIAGAAFLKANGIWLYSWHYVPFVALCGAAIECGLQPSADSGWRFAYAKTAMACLLAAASFMPSWSKAHLRRSNVDLIAAVLKDAAKTDDLILVNPFWFRASFTKYYQGKATWRTVPVPTDSDMRWDSGGASLMGIKTMMARENSIGPTLQMAQDTLRKSGGLWIVGLLPLLPANVLQNVRPSDLPSAPNSQYGWDNNSYAHLWSAHLGYFLQKHAKQIRPVALATPIKVDETEKVSLILIEGWNGS
jgi:hypothetical protein